MADLKSIPGERVCDLVDGRLKDDACAQALSALLSDPQEVQAWYAFHVVGDVLRSPELAPSPGDHAFLERFERRLALEPERPLVTDTIRLAVANSGLPSANTAVFRWKLLAGVACIALVGVVGMSLWVQTTPLEGAAMASLGGAAAPAATIVTADTSVGPMMRDPRLDELMAAHRQLGGNSALQVPTGFLRNATYEGAAR